MLKTITPIIFEAGDWNRPRIELRIRVAERSSGARRLRMQWVRETDIQGGKILRARWLADLPEAAPSGSREVAAPHVEQ